MNLLLVSVDALPRIGGISLMTHHLANALWAQGHTVIVLGPAGSCVPRELPHRYSMIEDAASDTSRRSGDVALAEDERIRRLVGAAIEKNHIDRVVLLHHHYYGVGTLDACRERNVRCSAYVHGLELSSQLREGYPTNHARLLEERSIGSQRERSFYVVGAVDEVLVNSRNTATLVEGFDIHPEVRVTGCGVPDSETRREAEISPAYSRAERERRRRRFDLTGGPCLSFVGRLVRAKESQRLIELCAREPDLCALIGGEGPEFARLERLISRWRLAKRVRLFGSVSESTKWSLLRASDFNCLLSQPDDQTGAVEGFGIALLEGAAAGAVPVTSGTGGMADVVRHLHTGVVVPRNDTDAGQILMRISESEEVMVGLVANSRRQLDERFSWSAVAANMTSGWHQ